MTIRSLRGARPTSGGSPSRRRARRAYALVAAIGAAALLLSACSSGEGGASGGSSGGATVQAIDPSNFTFPPCEQPMNCAAVPGFPDMGQAGAIQEFCPSEPITVALLDGIGNNQWRKITRAEFEDEASRCPGMQAVYLSADGSQQTFLSHLNSLVSRGIKVMVLYNDFGMATLPTITDYYKQGVHIALHGAPVSPDAVDGVDYTSITVGDSYGSGVQSAEFLNKVLPNGGTVIYIGGTPGNQLDPEFVKGYADTANSNIQIAEQVTGGWTYDGNLQAVVPLLSKYDKIDAIVTSYTATAAGAVQAFINAGLPVPYLVGQSTSMQNVCQYEQIIKNQPDYQMFSIDGDQMFVRIALRKALAEYMGVPDTVDPGPGPINNQPLVDTSKGLVPKCDPSAPPGTGFASDLPQDEVLAISQ